MGRTLLLFIILPYLSLAQGDKLPIDTTTMKVSFQEIVMIEGMSKDDLFIKANEWFARTFVSANDVIQMKDKEAGKIIGKGSSSGYIYNVVKLVPVPYSIGYTIIITVKDHKYKYELTSFQINNSMVSGTPIELYTAENIKKTMAASELKDRIKKQAIDIQNKIREQVYPNVGKLIESLSEDIKLSLSSKTKDDF